MCPEPYAPQDALAREDGWRALRIEGTLDFTLVGILAGIAALLAERHIPIFVVSTYDTDYLLVKKENLSAALDALQTGGYEVE